MTDQPTPQTEAGRFAQVTALRGGRVTTEDILAIEAEAAAQALREYRNHYKAAQAHTEALDVDALAEALHDAMCDVSHHDRPPARCSRWLTYPSIARSVVRRYKADR